MRRRRTALFTPLALLTVLSVAPGQDTAAVEREGKHFRIVFHGADLPEEVAVVLADECLAAAEAFWPTLDKLLPVRVTKPGTIHVYRKEGEYRAIETKAGCRFQLEVVTTRDLEGHVLLWPVLRKEILSAIGLPQPTIDNLRRAAAEQVVAPLAPAIDDGDWLRTVVVMGAVEAAANPRHLPGVDSAHDARRRFVVEKRRARTMDSFESLLALDMAVADRNRWDFCMANCAYVAQVLAADEAGWAKKLLGKQRELRGHVHAFDRRKVAVESVLGNDVVKNEARWRKVAGTMQPQWEVVAGLWSIGPQGSMLAGTRTQAAEVRAVEAPPAGDYVISGRCELGVGDTAAGFRIDLGANGKDTSSSYSVIFDPTGGVVISTWNHDTKKWSDQKTHRMEIAAGTPFEFRVEVTATEIATFVDGAACASWAHGGRDFHAYWGIAVFERLIWLEALKIAPLVAPKK